METLSPEPGQCGGRQRRAGRYAALALLALAAAPAARAAPSPPISAALLDGEAAGCAAEAPAECAPLRKGEAPRAGLVVSSEAGATIRMPGGALLRLEPAARVRFMRTMMVPLRAGEATPSQMVRVEQGTALATVPAAYAFKSAVYFFFSATRSALAKEGLTAVQAGDQGTSVAAASGTTLVTTDGRTWQQLRQGRGRRFAPGGADPVDFSLLPAPALGPSARLSVRGPGRPAPALRWTPVEGASSYDVRLTQEGRPEMVRALRVPAAQTSLSFEGLAPGSYAASLHAVGPDGMPGPPAGPAALTVVDLALPPGVAFGEGGQIRLGSHQRLALSPVGRVEASLGFDAGFAPAPAELGVGAYNARLVRLRQEGDDASVDLLLVRRPVRALVELGPATARWPATPVRIAVRLVDELGQSFDPPPPVRPQVRLGLEPLEVTWQAEGAALTATVEPRPLEGPSVLRVEIEDDRGKIVGRNFLELVPEARPPAPVPAPPTSAAAPPATAPAH
jgi:hypothetical protein